LDDTYLINVHVWYLMQAEEEDEDEEEESEYTSDESDDDDGYPGRPLLKPVFIPK
jgi:hypothetical protein